MGKATAEAIVNAGGKVCIVDYYQDRCEETAAALGDAVYCECADVSDTAMAEKIVGGAVGKFGYLNVVVNCAGVGSGNRILPKGGGVYPIDEFRRVIDINLIGTFNYVCYGARAICEAPENDDGERGVIINTTSQAYSHGQIGQVAYSASKGGVEALTIPIARELARFGIRINTISPALVDTNMTRVDGMGEPSKAPLRALLPGMRDLSEVARDHFVFPRRQGYPSEYASLAIELIRNTLLNGGSYQLDGAMRFGPKF